MKERKIFGLILAILIATVSISASIIYLANSKGIDQDDLRVNIEKQQEQAQKAQAEANKPKFVKGDFSDDDAVLGDENAQVTIVEWSDYECPFCKRYFTQTFKQIKEKYVDTGKVKYVFRDFPLEFHDPLATQEAMAAECVRDQGGDKAYFAYHDLLFENTASNGRGLEKLRLYEFAEDSGVNKIEFTECLDSEKFKDEVMKDIVDGQKAGVSGTPAFLINGRLISGAQPFSAFERVIEDELKNGE